MSKNFFLKHKKRQRDNRSQSPERTNLIDFSFLNHKNFLESLIFGYKANDTIIENLSDFWAFVSKYENVLKKNGQPILSDPIDKKSMKNYLSKYHKRMCTFIEIDFNKDDILHKIMYYRDKQITWYRCKQFFEFVILYLDFKQREKFNKLKKLRRTQNSLPIYEYKTEIENKIRSHQVIIIAGDTGCGKSTQIPQYMIQFGYKNVACTQPRRLACISLSKRVAHEMLSEYETKVGYQIRFEKNRNSITEICFITEGLLLRQLALDSNLSQYDVLILDEIHERNLYGDFLLGVTKCLLKAKPQMKIILMSATINISLFSTYFQEEDAAIIEVPGRLYPIKTHYMPCLQSIEEIKSHGSSSKMLDRFSPEPYIQILKLIDQKYDLKDKGDVLMFVSGVNEITIIVDAAKEYAKHDADHWIILPLHSGLSLADQDKVFDYAPDNMRKCIVSTNIAETSLTVDGVRFVIDSGKVKEMSYDASNKISRLKEFWVSKSSAEQRKGRAGRTGPGICYRLYSEKDYEEFESYTTPEIHKVPLESILLQMISMGLTDVRIFPFIESPSKENIERAILSLKQHEALTSDEKLTALGKALSTLPVEISIGKMLLMGCVFQELERILTLAAVLSVQSPFTNRAFKDYKCSERRREFESNQGDVFTLLNLLKEWLQLKYRAGENTRKWCYQMGIEEQRFYEIIKLRQQFSNILENCNIIEVKKEEILSSAERAIRNGEVRNLKAIKRVHKMEAPRKRKLLKRDYDSNDDNGEQQLNNDYQIEDIRDIDFRLRNDSRKIEELIRSATVVKHRDVVILKTIIVSGFYPQIAIPDEFNYCKSGNQQFFHTFAKPFVSLHPNGQFATNYELLKLSDSDIVTEKPPYYTPRLLLSYKHQLLCYQTLLETTKPYLLNCTRMPSASTLLLFSFQIDTNVSITRIICDTWLCLEFPTPESGQELLLKVINVRYKWKKLLSKKLEDIQQYDKFTPDNNTKKLLDTKKIQKDYEDLWDSLINLMSVNITYAIKRLLPADIKDLYTHQQINLKKFKINPFQEDFNIVHNINKGGLNVTENVVYGCLREEKWTAAMDEYMKELKWVCSNCNKEKPIIGISKLFHKVKCKYSSENKSESNTILSNTSKNTKYLFCEICNCELYLTPIQMLKHKKECK